MYIKSVTAKYVGRYAGMHEFHMHVGHVALQQWLAVSSVLTHCKLSAAKQSGTELR